jgi:hypothetical protein
MQARCLKTVDRYIRAHGGRSIEELAREFDATAHAARDGLARPDLGRFGTRR